MADEFSLRHLAGENQAGGSFDRVRCDFFKHLLCQRANSVAKAQRRMTVLAASSLY